MNPILFAVGAASVFCFGPSFLLYVAGSYAASAMAGAYCEEKINDYDHAIRRRAKEITGRNQPGNASEYAKFVSKTTACLGPFIPILPAAAACAGMYFSHEAKSLNDGSFFERGRKSVKLRKGFVAEGQFKY